MKLTLSRTTAGLVALAIACGGGDRAGGDGGGGGAALDWLTSSCSELGGTTAPLGACHVNCADDTQCRGGSRCSNHGVWSHNFCRIQSCSREADCGGIGWICHTGGCFLRCSVDTGGAQSVECPTGYQCMSDPQDKWCVGFLGGPTCGEPCPSGCCSDSRLICCQPPFCGGDCVGSPCCG